LWTEVFIKEEFITIKFFYKFEALSKGGDFTV
jgi:hypothetical protein